MKPYYDEASSNRGANTGRPPASNLMRTMLWCSIGLAACGPSTAGTGSAAGILDGLRSRFAVAPLPSHTPAFARQLAARAAALAGNHPVFPNNDTVALSVEGDDVKMSDASAPTPSAVKPQRLSIKQRADAPASLADTSGWLEITMQIEDTMPTAPQIESGYLVYRGAHRSGATLIRRPQLDSLEDYFAFDTKPQTELVSYQVQLGPRVAGLRLVANALEFLGEEGTPGLRLDPPYLIDSNGKTFPATVQVEGCAIDARGGMPWGRTPTDLGARTCRVTISWADQPVVYPAVLDPSWIPASSLPANWQGTPGAVTSFLINWGTRFFVTNFYIFDLPTGTWAKTANPPAPPNSLSVYDAIMAVTDPSRQTGQPNGQGLILYLAEVPGMPPANDACKGMMFETYDPTTDTWAPATSTAIFNQDIAFGTATTLADGNVFVTAGLGDCINLADATSKGDAYYNPQNKTWTGVAQGNPSGYMGFGSAVLLQDGVSVLYSGGYFDVFLGLETQGTSIYSETTNAWVVGPNMSQPRAGHTSLLEPSGNVMIGDDRAGKPNTTSEEYQLKNNVFTAPTAGIPRTGYSFATALGATAGTFTTLLIGGSTTDPGVLAYTNNPAPAWIPYGNPQLLLPDAVQWPTVMEDPLGQIVVVGGVDSKGGTSKTYVLSEATIPAKGVQDPPPELPQPWPPPGNVNPCVQGCIPLGPVNTDNGNPAGPNLYVIFFGAWPPESLANPQARIFNSFLSGLSGSTYETTITQYYDYLGKYISGNFQVGLPYFIPNLNPNTNKPFLPLVNGVQQGIIQDDPTQNPDPGNDIALITALVDVGLAGYPPPDPNGIYVVIAGTDIPTQYFNGEQLVTDCGWHTGLGFTKTFGAPAPPFTSAGVVVIPNPNPNNYTACYTNGTGTCVGSPGNGVTYPSPNNDVNSDFFVNVAAHEVNESTTDPLPWVGPPWAGGLNPDPLLWAWGWRLGGTLGFPNGLNGNEIADVCETWCGPGGVELTPYSYVAASALPTNKSGFANIHLPNNTDYFVQGLTAWAGVGAAYCELSFNDLEDGTLNPLVHGNGGLTVLSGRGVANGRFESIANPGDWQFNVKPPAGTFSGIVNNKVKAHGGSGFLALTATDVAGPPLSVQAVASQNLDIPGGQKASSATDYKHLKLSYWYNSSCTANALPIATYQVNLGAAINTFPANCIANTWTYVSADLSSGGAIGNHLHLNFEQPVPTVLNQQGTLFVDDVMLVEYGH